MTYLAIPGTSRLSTTGLLGCVAVHAAVYVLVETSISHAVVKRAVGSDGGDSRTSQGSASHSADSSLAGIEGVP